jgi:hypothetical protein
MASLSQIVDSLNLKFKQCEEYPTFYSLPQAVAYYIDVKFPGLSLRNAIRKNMSYDEIIEKFPKVKEKAVKILVTRTKEKEKNITTVEYTSLSFRDYGDKTISFENQPERYQEKVKNTWIVDSEPNRIRAFYFLEEIESKPLKNRYAQMVGYSECMIDTTSDVFLETANSNYRIITSIELPGNNSAVQNFYRYSDSLVKVLTPIIGEEPSYSKMVTQKLKGNDYGEELNKLYKKYNKAMVDWVAKKNEAMKKFVATPEFQAKIKAATEEAKIHGNSGDRLEYMVEQYYSAKEALYLKRNRIVYGSCSQDDSPRRHAVNIARLSAQTASWEVFLRAHLNVMNDHFHRVSDGSYAWGRRKTYFRELEELNINAVNLMFGITMRVDNPSSYHYYGTIWRVGRALAETQHPNEIENTFVNMLKDDELDDYNKTMVYFLFRNYVEFIADDTRKISANQLLNETVKDLPDYMQKHIEDLD